MNTNIIYDKPVPYRTTKYSKWNVPDKQLAKQDGDAYTKYGNKNYLGTQSVNIKEKQNYTFEG